MRGESIVGLIFFSFEIYPVCRVMSRIGHVSYPIDRQDILQHNFNAILLAVEKGNECCRLGLAMSHPNLNIYCSNRMEILAEKLAQIVRTPLRSPLAAEIIVVQSRGMERWISMKLAEFNGISANCSFPFPNAFLENIFKTIKPDLPDISPFDPEILTFRLMRIIPDCLNLDGFENLKSYLGDDDNRQLKLFQLSGKIADLFDQYLVFRPELIFEWEAGKEKNKSPHTWQARLWRELVGEIGNWHRARLRQALFQQINQLKLDSSPLPARISIFGISYLPLFHLQAFAELSRLIEINFFIVDPCKEYWSDIVSDREISKSRRKTPPDCRKYRVVSS